MPDTPVAASRRRSRVLVLQALYETDTVHHDINETLEDGLENKDFLKSDREFAREVVRGVLANQEELDNIIVSMAPSWPLNQMAVVDRNILRFAIYEMTKWGKSPHKVAINEAVELAKRFGSENSQKFVNGVLGSVHQEYVESKYKIKMEG